VQDLVGNAWYNQAGAAARIVGYSADPAVVHGRAYAELL
jgi:hypothetical protein